MPKCSCLNPRQSPPALLVWKAELQGFDTVNSFQLHISDLLSEEKRALTFLLHPKDFPPEQWAVFILRKVEMELMGLY